MDVAPRADDRLRHQALGAVAGGVIDARQPARVLRGALDRDAQAGAQGEPGEPARRRSLVAPTDLRAPPARAGGVEEQARRAIVRFATQIGEAVPSLYLYAYTNGILGKPETYAVLRDAGIRELRFDLAATDFSAHVIENMSTAHPYFERVAIEIPALPEVVEPLRELAPRLSTLRVKQINLCEVVINEYNAAAFKGQKLYKFNPNLDSAPAGDDRWDRWTRLVPQDSRHATYDVIETAEKEGWPVVINDCAQGVHYKPELPL
jgi:pyruvate formate-lyase activating enzyme-like uncharacterized protein